MKASRLNYQRQLNRRYATLVLGRRLVREGLRFDVYRHRGVTFVCGEDFAEDLGAGTVELAVMKAQFRQLPRPQDSNL